MRSDRFLRRLNALASFGVSQMTVDKFPSLGHLIADTDIFGDQLDLSNHKEELWRLFLTVNQKKFHIVFPDKCGHIQLSDNVNAEELTLELSSKTTFDLFEMDFCSHIRKLTIISDAPVVEFLKHCHFLEAVEEIVIQHPPATVKYSTLNWDGEFAYPKLKSIQVPKGVTIEKPEGALFKVID